MRIVFLVEHLSTGGMPQYTLWLVREMVAKGHEVHVIEYSNISDAYTVQKSQIHDLIKSKHVTLHGPEDAKAQALIFLLTKLEPDVVHLQEFPEMWLPDNVSNQIYSKDRTYRIIETSHDSGFDPASKRFWPDGFSFISSYHPPLYKDSGIPITVVEYPIIPKVRPPREIALLDLGLDLDEKHILNVGLFTPRKNQKEIFEMARAFEGKGVHFHFVGNQADNFREYWEPLMKNKPDNCTVWGERSDIDDWYAAVDAFLFTSKGTDRDRETNPLVLKEALGWGLPVFMYNLPVYMGSYDDKEGVHFLGSDIKENIRMLGSFLGVSPSVPAPTKLKLMTAEDVSVWYGNDQKVYCQFKDSCPRISAKAVLKDLDTQLPMYNCTYDIHPGTTYWMSPFNTNFMDLNTCDNIRGFTIEFYTMTEDFICSVDLPIRDKASSADFIYKGEPFDLVFCNFAEFFYKGYYEQVDFSDATVVDIGANVGSFTAYALHRGAKKVYAVEPNSKALLSLRANFEGHKAVTIIPKGAGKETRVEKLYYPRYNSTIASTDPNYVSGEKDVVSEEMHIATLPDLMKAHHIDKIDVLKIDTEGMEYDIFDAIGDEALKKMTSVIVEFHVQTDGKLRKHILNKLDRCGFAYKIYSQTDSFQIVEEATNGRMVATRKRAQRRSKPGKGIRVAQIKPPAMVIPPTKWGAVEKIVWQYYLQLEKDGYAIELRNWNDTDLASFDLVHGHFADISLGLHDRGIPYVFTLHDHHVCVYGKDSQCYITNLKAIDRSLVSILPSEELITYFSEATGTMEFVPHGVDTDLYTPSEKKGRPKILCVGNNGLLDNQSFDRKGFVYAVEAAKKLGLDVTVAGPTHNNRTFFNHHLELSYEKMDIFYDLDDVAIRDLYDEHHILVHATSIEAGHPPLTVLEAMACGLPVIGTYMGKGIIDKDLTVERNTQQVADAISFALDNYDRLSAESREKAEQYSWGKITKRLESVYDRALQHKTCSPA